MTAKRTTKKAPAKAGASTEDAKGQNLSILRMLDSLKRDDRRILFRAVAERLRTGLLTEDEAALIAGWFDALADGKNPADVLLGERRGRPSGKNTATYIKGMDVSLPDHVDLCWTMRRAIARTGNEDQVFGVVAEKFGKTVDHIRRLYQEIEPTLANDPDAAK